MGEVKIVFLETLRLIFSSEKFFCALKTKTIVKGDAKSFSIAAASIIAKVTRDRIMREASNKFPEYCWDQNKGYGTRAHIEAVKKHGACLMHRKTFLKKILNEESQEKLF